MSSEGLGGIAQGMIAHSVAVIGGTMSRSRMTLLGGPVFFVLWFIAANVLHFAKGGDSAGSPLPGPAEFPGVVLANESSMYLGATLFVLAGIALLWFGVGLTDRVGSGHRLELVVVVSAAAVSILLFIEGGLVAATAVVAAEAPEMSWTIDRLASTVGFETFISTLLGAAVMGGLIIASTQERIAKWLWWLTLVFASVLTVAGTLEGLGVVPSGRFSIFFGLWAVIAGLSLTSSPAPGQQTPR